MAAWRRLKGVINATETELRSNISASERLAEWCVFLIVAGLAIEIVLAVRPHSPAAERWGTVFATALIALGVYGELLFSKLGSNGHGELQRRSDLKVAEANARASEANQKAKEAELALTELEERLAPRKVAGKEQELIATRISEFRGVTGKIGTAPPEIEGMRLEMGIHGALSMAGWKFTHGQPTHIPIWPGGVVVQTTLDRSSVAAGLKLAESLNELGIFSSVSPVLEDGAPRLFVMVGTKPDANDPEVKKVMEMTKAADKRMLSRF